MSEEKITKIIYLSVVLSLLMHLGLGIAVVKGGAKDKKKETIIAFNFVKEVKKDIKLEEPPKEKKPEVVPKKSKKVVDLTKKIKIVKPEEIKEQTEKPPEEAQNPNNFGIDKSLVDTSGKSSVAMAVPIGETMIGDPKLKRGNTDKFIKPEDTKNSLNTTSIDAISQMPKILKEVKPKYPEEARRFGIEGSVILILEIDEKGNVSSATIVKKMGYGMDEAALQAAHLLKFSPAFAGNTPVRVKIKYTFTFILDD